MESPLSSPFMTCFNRKHRRSQCLILQYKTHLWYARGWFVPPSFPRFCSSPKSAPDPTPLSQVGTNLPPETGSCLVQSHAELQSLEREPGLASHTNTSLQFFIIITIIIIATRHDVGIIILHFCEALHSKKPIGASENRATYKSETKGKHVLIKTNPTQKSGGETANPFSLPYTKHPRSIMT